MKQILQYLHGTLHHSLMFHKPTDLFVHGFVDFDWAFDLDYRKFTSNYCVYFGGNLIS